MPYKVIIFTSPTCGPCKRLKPELKLQAEKRGFELEIVELSDVTRPRFNEHGVRNVPVTMLVDEDGAESSRITGQPTPTALEKQLIEWGL